ncbi:hypothetical protein RclHR1_08240019 [Rhizophagus clarus]|nr:hypothetical protein RclHR1_08240019 [Rhizophagus clarus]
MSPISLAELCFTIRSLPCGKTAGLSGIPYEAFKHLSNDNLSWLLRLFNDCLFAGDILIEWQNASVYPIPKPTQFDGLLKNTRPIILLETAHKLLVSLITSQLSGILAKYNVLQDGNFAGLPGSSTQLSI